MLVGQMEEDATKQRVCIMGRKRKESNLWMFFIPSLVTIVFHTLIQVSQYKNIYIRNLGTSKLSTRHKYFLDSP
jgi:uncharacterized membrane protein